MERAAAPPRTTPTGTDRKRPVPPERGHGRCRRRHGARPGLVRTRGGLVSRTTGSADVERIYDRIAALYDLPNAPMERLGGDRRRRRLLARAQGDVLEVGIGTGRNLPHYPEGVELTGIDLSERMLERARERAHDLDRDVRLMRADVERLPFEDDCFDTVTAACVFCSVADALQGLREVRRV